MTKRLVDIDDQLLEQARAATGEKTIRGTVEASLRMAANQALLREHIDRLGSGYYQFDLDSFDEARAGRRLDLSDDDD